MKKILPYIGLIIGLIIIGFLIWSYFMDISFSELNKRDIQIISKNAGGQFTSNLLFTLYIGAIPIFYLICDKFSKLRSLAQKLIAIGIILGCGILNWQLRILELNIQFKELSKYDFAEGIQNSIDIRHFNFELYMLIGFCVGTFINTIIFSRKNRTIAK